MSDGAHTNGRDALHTNGWPDPLHTNGGDALHTHGQVAGRPQANGSADRPHTNGRELAVVQTLEILYGGAPLLLDERGLLRDAVGPLLARAASADFAVARFRLGAIDLRAAELVGLERCRVLIERLQAVSDGDALAASRAEVRARLALMAAFLESGRVEVRAAGGPSWAPDFSLLRGVSRLPGSAPLSVALLGAHFFARPYPVTGPAFTQISADPAVCDLLAERFEELWQGGYDVGFVLAERLRRLLNPARAPALPIVRELPPPTPAAVVRRALEARFGRAANGRPASRVLELADFQADAVARATAALARWGGVLLADGVGLGKTYMALALVEAELRAGGSVVVVAPAALRKEWLAPLRRLASAHGATLAAGRDAASARVRWVSHALLSRGTELAGLPPGLVVVDEAHAFRNPTTRRYRSLARLCRQARVVELTATPLNNALRDLYFQIRLFAADTAFAPVGVPDLRQAFRAGEAGGDVRPIVPVLREVVIRRTRPFLRDHYGAVTLPDGQALSLPRRAAPRPVRYALSPALPGGLPALASLVEGLRLAPYRLASYRLTAVGNGADAAAPAASSGGRRGSSSPELPSGNGGPPAPAALQEARLQVAGELLRCGLLKRLESSAAAFRASIRGLVTYLESFQQELECGRVLRPRDRALLAGEQLLLGALALAPAPAWLDRSRVLADVHADLSALRQLLHSLPEGADDPKRERLRQLVTELGEKVIVFTEYRETARELARSLATHRVGLVHGGGAWLGAAPVGRRELIERFAPDANLARRPAAHERVDVLVATDVLSEGLNLQDARCVISYDLPWNPVRLMQRIGRVDRLGSRHAEVQPFHFVPESGLEELLGLMRRIRRKVRLIRRALPGEPELLEANAGEAAAADDPLLRRILAGDGVALETAERMEAAPFEMEDRLRRLWRTSAGRQQPDAAGRHLALPLSISVVAEGTEPAVLLCFEGAGRCAWLVCTDGGPPRDDDVAAADILAAALSGTEAVPLDAEVLAAAEAAGRRALQERTARPAANGMAARAVKRVLKELAAERHRPDPARCARADLLLARLRAGLNAGQELALRDVLRAPPSAADAATDVLARLEATLLEESRSAPAPAAANAARADGMPQVGVRLQAPDAAVGPDPWGVRWRLVAAIQVRRARELTGAAPPS